MTKIPFVDAIQTEESKKNWAKLYKDVKGKKWVPPVKDKRGIQCETKIENPEEIAKFMRQVPNPTERK